MSMVDNGLMIEDYSDVDDILDGVYADLIDDTILEADRTRTAVSVFVSTIKSPAESELFIKQRLDDSNIDYTIEHIGVNEEDVYKRQRFGAKAFEQAAGFLRIPDGDEILDNTGVHPESYKAAEQLLKKFGCTKKEDVYKRQYLQTVQTEEKNESFRCKRART